MGCQIVSLSKTQEFSIVLVNILEAVAMSGHNLKLLTSGTFNHKIIKKAAIFSVGTNGSNINFANGSTCNLHATLCENALFSSDSCTCIEQCHKNPSV